MREIETWYSNTIDGIILNIRIGDKLYKVREMELYCFDKEFKRDKNGEIIVRLFDKIELSEKEYYKLMEMINRN